MVRLNVIDRQTQMKLWQLLLLLVRLTLLAKFFHSDFARDSCERFVLHGLIVLGFLSYRFVILFCGGFCRFGYLFYSSLILLGGRSGSWRHFWLGIFLAERGSFWQILRLQ